MPEYILLTVYKSGSSSYPYKPKVIAKFGDTEKVYKLFRTCEDGFETEESAYKYGERMLLLGKFI